MYGPIAPHSSTKGTSFVRVLGRGNFLCVENLTRLATVWAPFPSKLFPRIVDIMLINPRFNRNYPWLQKEKKKHIDKNDTSIMGYSKIITKIKEYFTPFQNEGY